MRSDHITLSDRFQQLTFHKIQGVNWHFFNGSIKFWIVLHPFITVLLPTCSSPQSSDQLQRAGSRLSHGFVGGESWTHHVFSFQTDEVINIFSHSVSLYLMRRKFKIGVQEAVYFLTFATIHWVDVFIRPVYRDIFWEAFASVKKTKDWNYMHSVWWAAYTWSCQAWQTKLGSPQT